MDRRTVLQAGLTAMAGAVVTGDIRTVASPAELGAQAPTATQSKPLGAHPLGAAMEGWQGTIIEVTYPPGVVSAAHQHPGPTFGYVVSGKNPVGDQRRTGARCSRPGSRSSSRWGRCTARRPTTAPPNRRRSRWSFSASRVSRCRSRPPSRGSNGGLRSRYPVSGLKNRQPADGRLSRESRRMSGVGRRSRESGTGHRVPV